MVFFCRSGDSLVPNSDAVFWGCIGTVLTHECHEQSVGIPVDNGCQIDIEVEGEAKRFLFEVSVGQELIYLAKLKVDLVGLQAKGTITQANVVPITHSHMIY